ncbi:MAG: 4Fe-4S dicluster domain-containing protein [Alphaproteobacteria bacterium]
MEQANKNFDVVIVGAGVSGLAAAIRLKQQALKNDESLSIAVIEKSAAIGAHIMGRGIIKEEVLSEIFPDWQARKAPLKDKVLKDKNIFIFNNIVVPFPKPKEFSHLGMYIVSSGELCEWLALEAEELGVEIFLKEAAIDFYCSQDGALSQIRTEKRVFEAKQFMLAEGALGYISEKIIDAFNLRIRNQSYSIAFKEIWQIDSQSFDKGLNIDFFAKTKDASHYAAGSITHIGKNQVALNFSLPLNYKNPYLDPFLEFQEFKNNAHIRSLLENGQRLTFGAKCFACGGYKSIPKTSFAGGVIIGDSAGFSDISQEDGVSNAMASAIAAADSVFSWFASKEPSILECDFDSNLGGYEFITKLYRFRNYYDGFKYGLLFGGIFALLDYHFIQGRYEFDCKKNKDCNTLRRAKKSPKVDYLQDDGIIMFDRNSSMFLTNVKYENQAESHLMGSEESFKENLGRYDAIETRYCPSLVYEKIEEDKNISLKIDFKKCINCKLCEIKDPKQIIKWSPPFEGNGTNYKKL